MKIRFISVIRVPLSLLGLILQFPVISSAQPKDIPKISLEAGSKYNLSIGQIKNDTAYLRVKTKNEHAVRNLSSDDFLVTKESDTAEILSCSLIAKSQTSDLAITFILDNSASMYHSYDSLTTYLDSFLDSLGDGLAINAMAFDNIERKRTYDNTRHEQLFIASSEFTQEKKDIKEFWHSYDTIRTDYTPLYETMIKGLERIIDRRKAGDSLRQEIMIVVTDGADNASTVTIEKLSDLVSVMPLTLFTLNFRSDPDGRLLWLAKKTHGDHYVAGDLRSLQATLDYLRKDISSSYKLVFQFPFRGAGGAR